MNSPKKQLLLQAAIDRLKETLPELVRYPWPEYEAARHFAQEAVTRAFPNRSNELLRLTEEMSFQNDDNRSEELALWMQRKVSLQSGLAVLQSMLEVEQRLAAIPQEIVDGARRAVSGSTQKVFLVHGRDDAWTSAVKAYVEKLGLEVVVLRDKPGGAHTIIEKLEANSDVGFAIVLLTADDEGALRGETARPRARQNVVFELGYFIGLISRSRVVALLEPGVEVFSDISGVQYIGLDAPGDWQRLLLRELKHAALDVR